jgi:hypothetical protein
VVADTIYGNSPKLIEAIEGRIGTIYILSFPSDTLCWLDRPITREKLSKYKGQVQSKVVVEKIESKPIFIKTLANSINNYFWYKRKVSEGTKGQIEYKFKGYTLKRRKNLQDFMACYKTNRKEEHHLFLLHKQCPGKHATENFCLA